MEIEIYCDKSGKRLFYLKDVITEESLTVLDLKNLIAKRSSKFVDINRQELRMDRQGKGLNDAEFLQDVLGRGIGCGKIFLKDRGFQVAWTTIFLLEYFGPLIIYLWVYVYRPRIFYNEDVKNFTDRNWVVNLAALCWSGHYIKRLYETLFVHRFSNASMPLQNMFRNCLYYWGFALYIAFHINHPLYTPPTSKHFIYGGLAAFIFCELGNFSIHVAFRDMRPPGSKIRRIPRATSNPFTLLFNLVSCPNYTYEIGSWVAFSIMTSCLPALIFTFVGGFEMFVWAKGKHLKYHREFLEYPKNRKAIVPFVF